MISLIKMYKFYFLKYIYLSFYKCSILKDVPTCNSISLSLTLSFTLTLSPCICITSLSLAHLRNFFVIKNVSSSTSHKIIRLSVIRSLGLQVYRSIGLQVFRSLGLQVFRSVGLQVCSSLGLQVFRFIGLSIFMSFRLYGNLTLQERAETSF